MGVLLLTILVNPITVYASGSASENESGDEEFTDWGDAFQDEDYKENLAEQIARTYATYFESYIGSRAEMVDEVAEYIGENYDRTISLYDNLYDYILPYSRQTVINIDGANLSTSIYGKPIRNKNNLKLINDYTKTMENSLPSTFVDIAGSKYKTGEVKFDVLPSWVTFENTCKCEHANISPVPNNHVYFWGNNSWMTNKALINNNTNGIMYIQLFPTFNEGLTVRLITSNNFNGTTPYLTKDQYSGYYNRWELSYSNSEIGMNGSPDPGQIVISGSCYLTVGYSIALYDGPWYYYDQTKRTLYRLNSSPNGSFNETQASDSYEYTFNIINSVDFDDYNDLINQLILDVNMENNITNSLLLELLTELRNQRDTYVQQDGDDIYNYIDYMMNKLLEVKDIHIEIPDLTPNMNGIVDGITALLNFLASIIRTIGSLVETLLEGLFHLIIPTDSQWDEISVEFSQLTSPLGWIHEFFIEATSNISELLFGRNVFDYDMETEDVEIVRSTRNVIVEEGLIYFDNITGAPKIPVHFSNSTSEYFKDIGTAYIIDMSWYAPFKPVGDVIVIAFCWLMFVWRVLHDLPNIIQGGSGIIDNSIPGPTQSEKIANQTINFKGVGVK